LDDGNLWLAAGTRLSYRRLSCRSALSAIRSPCSKRALLAASGWQGRAGCSVVVRASRLTQETIASRGQDARVEHWKLMNRLPCTGRPQNKERGGLFYEPIKILFCYAQLLKNLIKKPASDLAIAMNWDCSCPAICMLHSGMASFLPYHLKSRLFSRFLKVPSFGRHEWLLHLHLLEASILLLHTLFRSFRRHYQFGLRLIRSLAPGEAAHNCGYVGSECAIVFWANDYGVVIETFH